MPNKTFYVAEDDLPLLDRAQRLAGDNLSAAIMRGLRRFVATEEGIMQGHREITLTVGERGRQRRKQFIGTPLLSWRAPAPRGRLTRETRREFFTVYRTAREQFAVHKRAFLALTAFAEEDAARHWNDPQNWPDPQGRANEISDADLQVYPDADRLGGAVPAELAERVADILSSPDTEVLDI